MKVRYKHFEAIRYKQKLQRKIKKAILGIKISKKELKAKIASFKSLETDFTFCPYCGCDSEYMVDHEVPYPEVWHSFYCYRCHKKTAYADNSPYTHLLQDLDN